MATAKHFVIGCLIFLVVGGLIVVIAEGGIFFLGFNKYGDTLEADGMEFGRKTDQQGCEHEGLRRYKSARKAGNPIDAHACLIFTNGCFQPSGPRPASVATPPPKTPFSVSEGGPRNVATQRACPATMKRASTCLPKPRIHAWARRSTMINV